MENRTFLLSVVALPAAFLLSHCATSQPGKKTAEHDPLWPDRVPAKIDFARDVKPLLETQCLECHNSKDANRNAGLILETRKLALSTGRTPPVIVPGDPAGSLLIKVLQLDPTHPTNMPPAPDKIWGTRLKILVKWIREGAEWPENVRLIRPQDWQI